MFSGFITAFGKHKRRVVVGCVLLSVVALPITGKIWWDNTRTYPELIYPNKAVFHRGGWFFNGESNEIYHLHGQWYLNGYELLVPMEGPFNSVCLVRFEDRGRVYRVNHADGTRTELRIVNGEWSARCDDNTWASIYGLGDY